MGRNYSRYSLTTTFEILDGENHTINEDEVIICAAKDFPLFSTFTASVPVSKKDFSSRKERLLKSIEQNFRKVIRESFEKNQVVRN